MSDYRTMKLPELAHQVGYSERQIRRLVSEIPGHRTTKGGHHYFVDCGALRDWIGRNKEENRRFNLAPSKIKPLRESRESNPHAKNLFVHLSQGVQMCETALLAIIKQSKPRDWSPERFNAVIDQLQLVADWADQFRRLRKDLQPSPHPPAGSQTKP
jgi:hypothetical protein